MIIRAVAYEINLFWLALGYFSRIPMPKSVVYNLENLNHASRYFTLVGWLLGFLVVGIYYLSNQIFSVNISIWLCMIASLLLTGAFHEDGLADTADGLGGGFTREKKLSIMKDSRIGTYGASALLMALIGKFILLQEINNLLIAIPVAYALSRTLASILLFTMNTVSDSETEKPKPLAKAQSSVDVIILLSTCLPIIFLLSGKAFFLLIILLISLGYASRYYFNKQLGGVTGDCLGATQQIAELSIYLLFISQGI